MQSTKFVYPPGQGMESKKYMKSQSRKLFHSVIAIIGLALLTSGSTRIGAAGRIAGADDHGGSAEASKW